MILKLFSVDYPLQFGISCVSDQISTAEGFCMPIMGDKQAAKEERSLNLKKANSNYVRMGFV